MEMPEVTVFIDLHQLGPAEALAVIQQVGVDSCEVTDEQLGALMRDEDVTDALGDAKVHLTAESGIEALSHIGVFETGETEIDQQG